eukprot:COSAG06_NODE_290_length_18223_cov_5.866696_11_plen_2485_part_00
MARAAQRISVAGLLLLLALAGLARAQFEFLELPLPYTEPECAEPPTLMSCFRCIGCLPEGDDSDAARDQMAASVADRFPKCDGENGNPDGTDGSAFDCSAEANALAADPASVTCADATTGCTASDCCTRQPCELTAVTAPENGDWGAALCTVSGGTLAAGGSCDLTCSAGFRLVDDTQPECSGAGDGTLSSTTATCEMVTCDAFDCSADPKLLRPAPEAFGCAADPCTSLECCTVVVCTADFDCSAGDNTVAAAPEDINCVGDPCTADECCTTVTCAAGSNGAAGPFDCAGSANILALNPSETTCLGDPCTADECCIPVTCANQPGGAFSCSDAGSVNFLTATPETTTCASDICTSDECCTRTACVISGVTEPENGSLGATCSGAGGATLRIAAGEACDLQCDAGYTISEQPSCDASGSLSSTTATCTMVVAYTFGWVEGGWTGAECTADGGFPGNCGTAPQPGRTQTVICTRYADPAPVGEDSSEEAWDDESSCTDDRPADNEGECIFQPCPYWSEGDYAPQAVCPTTCVSQATDAVTLTRSVTCMMSAGVPGTDADCSAAGPRPETELQCASQPSCPAVITYSWVCGSEGTSLGLTLTDYAPCAVWPADCDISDPDDPRLERVRTCECRGIDGSLAADAASTDGCSEQPSVVSACDVTDACPCAVGTYGTPQLGCTPCPPGEVQPEAATAEEANLQCIQCPPGQFDSEDGEVCTDCEDGSVQPNSGTTSCTACIAGQYDNGSNDETCVDCESGKAQASTGQTGCVTCLLGQVAPTQGSAACTACPIGKYDDGTTEVCAQCLAGQSQSLEGQTSCADCASGHVQPSQGQPECTACIAGQYDNDAIDETCVDCEVGKAQPASAQTGCIPCLLGWVQPATGQTDCAACSTGRFDGGAEDCADCADGKVQPATGQTTCTACTAGKYDNHDCDSATETCLGEVCVECASGQVQPLEGQTACTTNMGVNINFQPPTLSVPLIPLAYVPDSGAPFDVVYTASGFTHSFGWTCDLESIPDYFSDGVGRDSSLVRLDSTSACDSNQFEVELPNALYHVGVGYSGSYQLEVSGCQVEGVAAYDSDTLLGSSHEFQTTIQLEDGRLTFQGDHENACTQISYLIITKTGTGLDDSYHDTCADSPIGWTDTTGDNCRAFEETCMGTANEVAATAQVDEACSASDPDADPIVTESDTTACTLSGSPDFGATTGTCTAADETVATCAYVAGTYSGDPLNTVDTADSCTSTTVLPDCTFTAGDSSTCGARCSYVAAADAVPTYTPECDLDAATDGTADCPTGCIENTFGGRCATESSTAVDVNGISAGEACCACGGGMAVPARLANIPYDDQLGCRTALDSCTQASDCASGTQIAVSVTNGGFDADRAAGNTQYFLAGAGATVCPAGAVPAGEHSCLEAAQRLRPSNIDENDSVVQMQVGGGGGNMPQGCSVLVSDWTPYYRDGIGQNNGDYSLVCGTTTGFVDATPYSWNGEATCSGTADTVEATCTGSANLVEATCTGASTVSATCTGTADEVAAVSDDPATPGADESADAYTPLCDLDASTDGSDVCPTGCVLVPVPTCDLDDTTDGTGTCSAGCDEAAAYTPVCDLDVSTDTTADCPPGCAYSPEFTPTCDSPTACAAGCDATSIRTVKNGGLGLMDSASGSNFLELQGDGVLVSQDVYGLSPGYNYVVTFLASYRPGRGENTLDIQLGAEDSVSVSVKPTAQFSRFAAQFTASEHIQALRFIGRGIRSASILIDDVQVMTADDNPCAPCAIGRFYHDGDAATSCSVCPAGEVQPLTGQSICNACPAGKFDAAGAGLTWSEGDRCSAWKSVISLDPDPYSDAVKDNAGGACLEWRASDYDNDCFRSTGGGADADPWWSWFSELCSGSSYWYQSTLQIPLRPSEPPSGSSPENEICTDCIPGYIQVEEGRTLCDACTPGLFSNTTTECTECSAGRWSDSAAATCSDCPVGQYQNFTGQDSCTECPHFHVSPTEGAVQCSECPYGTYDDGTEVCATEWCGDARAPNYALSTTPESCDARTEVIKSEAFSAQWGTEQLICKLQPPGAATGYCQTWVDGGFGAQQETATTVTAVAATSVAASVTASVTTSVATSATASVGSSSATGVASAAAGPKPAPGNPLTLIFSVQFFSFAGSLGGGVLPQDFKLLCKSFSWAALDFQGYDLPEWLMWRPKVSWFDFNVPQPTFDVSAWFPFGLPPNCKERMPRVPPGWAPAGGKDCLSECEFADPRCTAVGAYTNATGYCETADGDSGCPLRWLENDTRVTDVDGTFVCEPRWEIDPNTEELCCTPENDPFMFTDGSVLLDTIVSNLMVLFAAVVGRFVCHIIYNHGSIGQRADRQWDHSEHDFLVFPYLECTIISVGYCGIAYSACGVLSQGCNQTMHFIAIVALLVYPILFSALTALSAHKNPNNMEFQLTKWGAKKMIAIEQGGVQPITKFLFFAHRLGVWPLGVLVRGWGEWTPRERALQPYTYKASPSE